MNTRFVEVTQAIDGGFNHGKFMVGKFETVEWLRRCELDVEYGHGERPLLLRTGWSARHVMVVDLQTGEGAMFAPWGLARADLDKHRVWVCPMFEPFLEWLYEFLNEEPFETLPPLVELPDAPAAMQGYRREGPSDADASIASRRGAVR